MKASLWQYENVERLMSRGWLKKKTSCMKNVVGRWRCKRAGCRGCVVSMVDVLSFVQR